MPIHWLMARDTAPTSYVIAILPLRFSSLRKRLLLAVFLAHFLDVGLVWDSFHFSDRICGIVILLAVSGMDFSRCQPPCSRLIASDDQHGKCVRCVGLAHARDAIFGISNCKYCENFTLKTLRARLVVFDRESAILPRRTAPEASSLREAAPWSLDAELEAMESEQFSLSLPPLPGLYCANSPVQFSHSCLAPSPEAREAVSFGLEDILYTAASDSEDFGAMSLDVLPPSVQEARPSPAYTELVDVLACATEKLSLDWPDEPCESQSSKLDERFLSGSGSHLARRKLPFFPDLHHQISRSWKQPFSSRLTNAAAADFTNFTLLVLWSRGTPQSRRSRTRSLRTSRRLPPPRGSPILSFRPSHVEPPLL